MAANEVPIDLVLRARDEMSAVLDRVVKETDSLSRSADKVQREVDGAGDELGQFARQANAAETASGGFSVKLGALANIAGDLAMRAMSAIGGAITDVASAMINGNAEFERYTVQFGVLLGGADKAQARLKELAEFGAKTPFELPEVVRADKILQSFGLHSEESAKKFGFSGTQIRTIAGDLAAGTGQGFEDMTRYLGMFASGATGEAISRFQELGITTREELAKMGLQFSKSGELTTPTQEAFSVLLRVAQSKFGGMMDQQSKTFEGMLSNLNDWKGQTLRLIGEPIFEVLRDKLGTILEFLNRPETQQAIQNFATGIADTLRTVVTFIEENWPTIQATITTVFNAIAAVWNGVLRPVIEFGIELFTDLFNNVDSNFDAIQDKIDSVMSFLGRIIKQVLDTIWQLWEDNGSEISSFIRDTWDSISKIISDVVEIIVTLIQQNMPLIQDRIDAAMAAIKIIFETAWAAVKLVVGTTIEVIKGVISAALQFINGDTEGAMNTLKDTFSRIWENIKEIISGWLSGIKDAINEYLSKSGTDIDTVFGTIRTNIETAWTNIKNGVESSVNTIKNLTSAAFQEMRDDVTLAFNTMVNNIKAAFENVMRMYNTIAPFMGLTTTATAGFGTLTSPQSQQTTANNNSYEANVVIYANNAGEAQRGTVDALRRAGFQMGN